MLGDKTPRSGIRGALLVDADNFHDPEQLRAVHGQFGQHVGKGFICHVHGDAKLLHKESLRPVWQEMAARLMPCLPLNKNTTDAALVIDALMLHFQQGVMRFGIASGDADFAPLSLQLRELGCEVTCFARKSIAFEAMVAYYDRVVRFDVLPERLSAAPSELALTVSVLTGGIQPVGSPRADTLPLTMAIPAVVDIPSKADMIVAGMCVASSVDQVLLALPALRSGSPQHLSQVMLELRKQNIARPKEKARAFFAQFGSRFELRPATQPSQVVYRDGKARQPPANQVFSVPPEKIETKRESISSPVRTWPTLAPRRSTVVLSEGMNALRTALSEVAMKRICVADVLIAVPELISGAPCSLSSVAGRLRESGLLRSSQSALRIFERFPGSFVVDLQKTPQWVRYVA